MIVPKSLEAKRTFGVFIPGVFLLFNITALIYILFEQNTYIKSFSGILSKNYALSTTLIIVFGYLIGVILRLLKAPRVDKWSSWVMKCYKSNKILDEKGKPIKHLDVKGKQQGYKYKLYAVEDFPFIGWIGEVCEKSLPAEIKTFHDDIWSKRSKKGGNSSFFNFCKIQIISANDKPALEIYSAEALCRYVVGMFYALLCVLILISTGVAVYFLNKYWLHTNIITKNIKVDILHVLSFVSLSYSLALFIILRTFRHIRTREVKTVFFASFYHRDLFYNFDNNLCLNCNQTQYQNMANIKSP